MVDYDSWQLPTGAGRTSKKHWYGKDGVIKNISDVFKLPEGANERVKRVLDYDFLYEARGQVYKGERLKD
jgi:hypothetical protein